MNCTRPPVGWLCTRDPDHEGPCAAVPLALPTLRGRALTLVGVVYSCTRRWFEYLPFLGDYLFRRRIVRAWRGL